LRKDLTAAQADNCFSAIESHSACLVRPASSARA